MNVCREMPESKERRCGAVRYDTLVWSAVPCRDVRSELEPGGTQRGVIRQGSPRQVVHPVGYSFEDRSVRRQTVEGGPRYAGSFGLSAGDETPLILGEFGEATDGAGSNHGCILPH